ncbi:replication/maintenance protein RepL (plasmid) [Arsenophonus nasoniae]|uniref:Firmicute plasmid replication protein (RepL) n=2 Tax=Arsenophonus nasoniae TaxID=638 RepID=A0A4P7L9W2_9GAMM|nr:replication/maintenance protein RepL [Arsenophonus nasoniae]QBY45932.1 Firmicute plasmid replication protein (RepL) [Arsenophonus nasoniae]QBY46112.1 Firmicute plasmid replication protein (RepL) [Arsenophonus nasoniae]WGM08514.1 replication/maintenance protein RepL [Arsenophonus nasoniae]WGM13755.1 replication/maintenance protein RepL [Arsenophonus nasoniae]
MFIDNVDMRKNKDLFIQFSEKNIGAVREIFKKNTVSGDIFLFLTEFMNKNNAVVCSHRVLEEVTGKKRTTVSLAIKCLKDNGFITILKMGTSNVYVLNPHVVWRAWRTNKAYCKFEGPILLSKSENEKITKEMLRSINIDE